jgi:hypothetical protein
MDVSERLKTLPGMSKVALSRLWEELFNKPVPERIRKELMVRILAYRIQEQAFGGLNPKIRRRLDPDRWCTWQKPEYRDREHGPIETGNTPDPFLARQDSHGDD